MTEEGKSFEILDWEH